MSVTTPLRWDVIFTARINDDVIPRDPRRSPRGELVASPQGPLSTGHRAGSAAAVTPEETLRNLGPPDLPQIPGLAECHANTKGPTLR